MSSGTPTPSTNFFRRRIPKPQLYSTQRQQQQQQQQQQQGLRRSSSETSLQRVPWATRQFSSRVAADTERELVLEIERLKRKSPKNGLRGDRATTAKIDQYLRGVEEDRNYWKQEAEELNRMLRTPVPRSASRGPSPTRLSRSPSKTRSASPLKSKVPKGANGKKLPAYDSMRLSEQQPQTKDSGYSSQLRGRSPSRGRSPPTRDRPLNGGGVGADDSELLRVKRERDELQALLDKFERHMGEIQSNVRGLTQERDQLNRMLDAAKDELHRARRDLMAAPTQPKVSLAAQAVLKRVETERDDAMAELRRVAAERDGLRDRLKVAMETALGDKVRLEQRIDDVQNVARKAATERDEYCTRANSLRQRCQELEEQAKNLQRNASDKSDELANERASCNQQRILTEASQRQCKQLEADLLQAQEAAALLQDRGGALERELKLLRDDQAELRSCMNGLEYDKDSLESSLQERSERARALEEELRNRDSQANDLRTQVHHAEYQLSRLQDQLAAREKDLRASKKANEAVQSEMQGETRRCEALQREVARLQDDLQVTSRENNSLQAELQETMDEREQFKTKAQDYLSEVRRVEELLGQKEQERSDLLEQYRLLTSESDKFQTEAHQLESDVSSMRLELMAKDADCKRLRERLDQAEEDLQDNRHTVNSYEMQVANLTRSVSDLEDSLRQQQYEREEVLKDLAALRDLCAKLESSKDQVQRQLTTKALDADQLASQIDDLQHDNDLLREQLGSEQDAKKSLETVLSASREKEFQLQLDTQERQAELGMLQDRMDLGDTKLEQQGRELTRLRARNTELETELERITRQLASERFERDRLATELRRQGGSGGAANLYGSHGALYRSDSRGELSAAELTSAIASGAVQRDTSVQYSVQCTHKRHSVHRSNVSPSRQGILKPSSRSHSPAGRYEQDF